MKIIAVIVTYNRLELLKKSIGAVQGQSRKPDEVLVINNGSTDNTKEWLLTQPVFTHNQKNIGGAGGFAAGINLAYQQGADWIWLLDDDTIAAPDALYQLEYALTEMKSYQNRIGFLSSKVLWTNGELHNINRTYLLKDRARLAAFSFAQNKKYPLIQWGTFVSMLVSAEVVGKVGLPIKEFFIWCDDAEYGMRIIKSGYLGLAVADSMVVHETPNNHQSSVFYDQQNAIWKYKYGLRNELYTKRLHKGEMRFWVTWVHRMFIMPFRIMLKRKNYRFAFIKVMWKASWSALFFKPPILKADKGTCLRNRTKV